MLVVYQYPKCSTCRNALRWLDGHGIRHERIDMVASPPSAALLEQVRQRSGLPVAKLFNTSGQSYRQGNYRERLKRMSAAEAIEALANDGKLIRRPLLISPGVVLVGFDADAYERELEALRASDERTLAPPR
jgi:arsenate reductase